MTFGQPLEPYSSFIDAILAYIEDNKFKIEVPKNPWTAAAELIWLGHIHE